MDRKEYEQITTVYLDSVYRVALSGCGNKSDAEDVVQNTFIKLWEREESFGDMEHARKWLIRVTVNECKKFWRSPWRRTDDIEDYVNSMPFEDAHHSDLFQAIMALDKKYRTVIGHTDCGVAHINGDMMIQHLIQRGVSQDHIDMMRYCGIDFEKWLCGFDCVEDSVGETVDMLRHHPLMPADVVVKGYIIDTETGELFPQG